MTVNRDQFCATGIWLIITLIEYFWLNSMSYGTASLKAVSILILFNLITQLLTVKICGHPLVSFFTAFIAFMYLFHYGQVFLAAYFPDGEFDTVNYIIRYATDRTSMWTTIVVCVISINLMFAGGMLFSEYVNVRGQSGNVASNKKYSSSYMTCYYMGRILFAVATPLRLYVDIRQLIVAMESGYTGVYSMQSITGVIGVVAGFWYIGIALIYLTSENDRAKHIFLGVVFIYITITMLTGNRGHQIVNMIGILLVVYMNSNRRMKLWKVILILVIGVVALLFLDVIFEMRHYSISYFFSNFQEIVGESLEQNIFLETLSNFGSTIYTPYLVVEGYGDTITPFFGEAILKSFASIVPDAFRTFKTINSEAHFTRMLGTTHAIGGSLVGEMYYNFGTLYGVFSFIFGAVYGKLSGKIYTAIKAHEYSKVCLILPFVVYSLWWVRDTAAGITRPVVWLLILYWLISRNPKVVSADESLCEEEQSDFG